MWLQLFVSIVEFRTGSYNQVSHFYTEFLYFLWLLFKLVT